MNLQSGSSGPGVAQVQTILQSNGYDVGPTGIDGQYGAHTEAAVKQYQSDHGLTSDGIVGPETAASLGIQLPDANGNYTNSGAAPAAPAPTTPNSVSFAPSKAPWIIGGLLFVGGVYYWWKHR